MLLRQMFMELTGLLRLVKKSTTKLCYDQRCGIQLPCFTKAMWCFCFTLQLRLKCDELQREIESRMMEAQSNQARSDSVSSDHSGPWPSTSAV